MLVVEGILTFISPCLLPLLPLYLSYFGARKSSNQSANIVKESLHFVAGFTLIFTIMSLFVNTVSQFFIVNRSIISLIAGTLMIIFGIDQLTGNKFSSRLLNRSSTREQPVNAFLFGILFAVNWTPCIGIYLASALSVAMTADNHLTALLMILAYCLGLGIPFILSALLIDESIQMINRIKPHLQTIQKISGLLLIIFGLLVATGYIYQFMSI